MLGWAQGKRQEVLLGGLAPAQDEGQGAGSTCKVPLLHSEAKGAVCRALPSVQSKRSSLPLCRVTCQEVESQAAARTGVACDVN